MFAGILVIQNQYRKKNMNFVEIDKLSFKDLKKVCEYCLKKTVSKVCKKCYMSFFCD